MILDISNKILKIKNKILKKVTTVLMFMLPLYLAIMAIIKEDISSILLLYAKNEQIAESYGLFVDR